jgi:hypothetical protein
LHAISRRAVGSVIGIAIPPAIADGDRRPTMATGVDAHGAGLMS